MPAILTTLKQQIVREERSVGMPTDQPLTKAAISRRHGQIGWLLGFVSLVAVATLAVANSELRVGVAAIALAFGVYAVSKERHLRRLTLLHRDECTINLTVVDSLLRSGALKANPELLDLRTAVEEGAVRLAADLADVVPAACAGLRLVGPSGETPVAALSGLSGRDIYLDPSAASEALRTREPIRRGVHDGRTVIAVPLEHHDDIVGVLEVISTATDPYTAHDADLVSAFARGAVCGLLSGRLPTETS